MVLSFPVQAYSLFPFVYIELTWWFFTTCNKNKQKQMCIYYYMIW